MQHDLTLNAIAWEQRGVQARDAGRHAEALSCFERALALSDRALSWLGLALSQIDLKQTEAAVDSLRRALGLAPQSGVVRHLLAALSGENTARAPDGYVTWLFNSYAGGFDNHLARLGYRGPDMLHGLASLIWQPQAQFRILDLGCGTGLSGVPFRAYASRLDGIDLAAGMIEQAARRGIYDNLTQSEIHAALDALPPGSYDLLLAADTLIYIGDVAELFRKAAMVLRPGGSFLFTIETGNAGSAFTLTRTGRYSHAEDYLRDCSKDLFAMEAALDGMIRIEDGHFIEGRAYRLTRAD